jgi:ribosomal protein L16 Arg81 hydroxylase
MDLSACIVNEDLDCLVGLLTPMSGDEFLRNTWGKKLIHIAGPREKFEGLFSWDLLNEVLERYPFEPPRLRLFRHGKEITPDKYLLFGTTRDGRTVHSLKSPELTNQLIEGATLILDFAEEISPSLRELCVGLERIFRRKVVANLYAGFRTDNGFSLHWDYQDTLILQVAGSKKWQIYAPTDLYPLQGPRASQKPDSPPVWDGLIQQGCLFHIPRGWWHVAYPVDEPSLHLTVTVESLTGLDLLRWFVDGLKTSPLVRANIPVWDAPGKHVDYVESLRQELNGAWRSDLVGRFLDEMDARANARPQFRLPAAATSNGSHVDDDTSLRISSAGRAVVSTGNENGITQFKYNRKVWTCPDCMVPVLNLVNDGRKHPVRELLAVASNQEHREEVRDFINKLIREGILVPTNRRGSGVDLSTESHSAPVRSNSNWA